MTSYFDQIVIDLVKDNIWSPDRVEIERAQLQDRIDIASGDIKTAQSKINAARPTYIENVRAVGYRMARPKAVSSE